MRKLFLVLILICIVITPVYSGNQPVSEKGPGITFLVPRGGTSGIPMAPDRKGEDGHYTAVQTSSKPWLGASKTDVKKGYYTGEEILVQGGVRDMVVSGNQARTVKLYVTVNCPNGFYFTSASNPSYKRPFTFSVVPRAYDDDDDLLVSVLHNKYGSVQQIDATHSRVELTLKEIYPTESLPDAIIWFDLVLVLPGNMMSGDILVTDNGGQYPLVIADDYNAVASVTVQTSYTDKKGEHFSDPITQTIPFSGFYDPKNKNNGIRDTSSNISMYVHPTAAAGNLDLKNYGRQQIANLVIQSTEDVTINLVRPDKVGPESFYLFLSSESDPTVKGEPFKLVLDDIRYGTSLTPYNSVEYKVILTHDRYDNKKTRKEIETVFTGTDTGTASNRPPTSVYPDRSLYQYDPREDNVLQREDTYVWDYSGSAYVQITDNSGYVMKAGRYTSKVYVHVVEI